MRRPPARPHKLNPNRQYLVDRVRAAHRVWLLGTMLLVHIAEQGYTVGLSRLRAHLLMVKSIEPLIRFETPVGQQTQCD